MPSEPNCCRIRQKSIAHKKKNGEMSTLTLHESSPNPPFRVYTTIQPAVLFPAAAITNKASVKLNTPLTSSQTNGEHPRFKATNVPAAVYRTQASLRQRSRVESLLASRRSGIERAWNKRRATPLRPLEKKQILRDVSEPN